MIFPAQGQLCVLKSKCRRNGSRQNGNRRNSTKNPVDEMGVDKMGVNHAFTSNLIKRIFRGLGIFPFTAVLPRSKQHTIFVTSHYFSAIVGYFVMLLSSQLLQYSTKHNQFCILEWLYNGIVQVFDGNLPPTSPEMQGGKFFNSFPQVYSIEAGMTMIQIQEGETWGI